MKVFLKFLKRAGIVVVGGGVTWGVIRMAIGFYYMMMGAKEALIVVWSLLVGALIVYIKLLRLLWD
jgi:hypothetical protein